MLLKRLYTFSSLKNVPGGVQFSVKNRLSDVKLVGVSGFKINGVEMPLAKSWLVLPDGRRLSPLEISRENPLDFPLRQIVDILVQPD